MTPREQDTFIDELIDFVKAEVKKHTYPDTWDGIELRWLIAANFSNVVFGGYTDKRKKRYQDFANECIVNNW